MNLSMAWWKRGTAASDVMAASAAWDSFSYPTELSSTWRSKSMPVASRKRVANWSKKGGGEG